VLVVPEADGAGQALHHVLAQAGDGGGGRGRGRSRVAEVVADGHVDSFVDRVGVGVRPADGERAAGAADDAGRRVAVAPADEGGVRRRTAVRVGVRVGVGVSFGAVAPKLTPAAVSVAGVTVMVTDLLAVV